MCDGIKVSKSKIPGGQFTLLQSHDSLEEGRGRKRRNNSFPELLLFVLPMAHCDARG
jgi:hypothetical protein